MKRNLFIAASVFVLTASLAILALPCSGQNNNAQGADVISRDAVAYGKTYGQWDAAWQQWAYSIPVANHPLFENGDCSVGQTGPVWFLGGKFCANGATCDLANVVRYCKIPYGKAIYLPALNAEDSALEESAAENPGNEDAQQVGFMRGVVDGNIKTFAPYMIIDGVPVKNLIDKFTVQSDAFSFTIPYDNYLKAVYGSNDFPAGAYYPAVDAGQYVMIPPLPVGHHVIQLGGTTPWFTLNIKYNLTVTK